jgi:hypothetical protein
MRENDMGRACSTHEDRKVYKVLVGKPKGKSPLERPSYRWKAGIKMYLRMTGWEIVERIHLAWDKDQWKFL